MTPHFFRFREPAHCAVPRKKYRSLGLGKRQRVAIVNRDAPLKTAQPLGVSHMRTTQCPNFQPKLPQSLPAVILDLLLIERIRHNETIGKRKYKLDQLSTLQ